MEDSSLDQDLISVIIVNYNAGETLSLCLESLLETDCPLEVMIVDNASHDDSLAQVESRFPGENRIRIIRNQQNLGFATACNQGAKKSRGNYLLYLNPDCKIQKDAIGILKRCLDDHPDAGMVGGHLLNSDGSEQVGGRRMVPTPWRTFVRVFRLSFLAKRFPKWFSDFNLHQQKLPDHPIEVEAISGACMLVTREAYTDVGGLDEGYFLHCEDLDWCMSFQNRGWKILFVPEAKVPHFQGTCSRSRHLFVEWNKHKGMMRFYHKFFRKQYPGVLMWLVALGVWLRFGLLACVFSLKSCFRYFKCSWN